MKKLVTLFLALLIGFGLKAQCPLTQAVDFTATDVHGTEIHLFDILDSGQYVLIDFFFTTCVPCQQATPKIVESYYAFGCNQHDVFYMEIATGDSEAACLNWVNNYGVEYPTISGAAGGTGICSQYGIPQYPTVILIAPNHQIVIQDLWPIGSAQAVISALEAQGVEQHDCNNDDIMPDFTGTDLDGNEIHLYDILDAGQAVLINFFLTGDDFSSDAWGAMLEAYHLYGCNEHDVFFMGITPNADNNECQAWVQSIGGAEWPIISREGGGNDIAQAIPVALYPTFMLIRPDHTIAKRDIYPPTLEYIIQAMEAEGYEQHECPVVYDETLTFSMDTIELPYATPTEITVYNNTAEDAVIHSIQETNEWNNFCLITFLINGEEYWCPDDLEITLPRGESLTMSMVCDMVGKNDPEYIEDLVTVSSNLPDASFTVMVEHAWSVDENEASTILFPNPANESVTLSGKNIGTVYVYNALGQKVDEFEANGNELRINTTSYGNGVYFVKANGQTMKFVVKH